MVIISKHLKIIYLVSFVVPGRQQNQRLIEPLLGYLSYVAEKLLSMIDRNLCRLVLVSDFMVDKWIAFAKELKHR